MQHNGRQPADDRWWREAQVELHSAISLVRGVEAGGRGWLFGQNAYSNVD